MTDYSDIAQRIVALGPEFLLMRKRLMQPATHTKQQRPLTAEQFCNDGRVVLALMERCYKIGCDIAPDCDDKCVEGIWSREYSTERQAISVPITDSLALAIVLACLDALEGE